MFRFLRQSTITRYAFGCAWGASGSGKERSPTRSAQFNRTDFQPVSRGPRASERKFFMPTKQLPANPDLDHLKFQAKDLLKDHAAKEISGAQRLREFHPKCRNATDEQIFCMHFSLSDAHLTIAREYGFASWTRLKQHIERPTLSDRLTLPHHERIEDTLFRRGVELIDAGDVSGLRLLLVQNPSLVHRRVVFEGGNYFRNPSLLEFVAENPIRHGVLPTNIVEVTRVILEACPENSAINETLGLVATGQ